MILLRLFNLVFLLGLVACFAGALAGLIVFAPFVGVAWLLTLLAIAGFEPNSPAPSRQLDSSQSTGSSPAGSATGQLAIAGVGAP